MQTSEVLVMLRKNKKLSQLDVANVLGVDRTTYNKWETGVSRPVRYLNELANFYNVSTDYLLGKSEGHSTKGIKIPVLGRVVAGVPLEAIENVEGYEEITPAMASKGEYFGLIVKGQSMEPLMREGDTVIVRKQEQVETGEIAIVLVNGCDATIKKISHQENGITLIAYNVSVYEPHFYSKEDIVNLPITILGKVIESRHSFE